MLDPQKKLSILASNYRGEESGKTTYTEISHTSEAFTIESAIGGKKKKSRWPTKMNTFVF